ncbi:MAG: PD-(D/E)XK nuclease family protein [Promethearchaeia archaeon]
MNWSISKAKLFLKCQRRWFYSEVMASKYSKDPDRYEAYILKQLGSINSWRGKLVDYIIEKHFIPHFNHGRIPSLNKIERIVSKLMKKQLTFAKRRKYRDRNLTKKKAGNSFLALREIENSGGLKIGDVKKTKKQVIKSLNNLLQSDLMDILLDPNSFLVAQKNLNYKFHDLNVISRPDLIIYFKDKPPLIIDWKVYYYSKENAWMQLGSYAIALTECVAVDAFQKQIKDPKKINLIEYQLLRNIQKHYKLTSPDVRTIKNYIRTTSKAMVELVGNRKYHEIDFNQFKMTEKSEICKYCNFRPLCKDKNVKYQVSLKNFLD